MRLPADRGPLWFRRRPPRFHGKGAIEPVDRRAQNSGFYSTYFQALGSVKRLETIVLLWRYINQIEFNYFIIPKKGGGLRPILDLRQLNTHLKILIFHMLRTADVLQGIKQGDWLTTIDLKDAYFTSLSHLGKQFLRFAFEGRAYQFCVLPFGISLAPRVFTRCVAAALSPTAGQGGCAFSPISTTG